MTSDDGWADVRPAHRLSYQAYCEGQDRTWRALACSRLDGPDLVDQAVRNIRADLKRLWAAALREPDTDAYAWLIAKEQVSALALGTGGTPPPAVVADWLLILRSAGIPWERPAADHDLLYQAVLRLPERQYDMIVLHHLLGLELAEVARYFGAPEAQTRTAVGQGLAKLRRLLRADPSPSSTPDSGMEDVK
ncbi:sigma factor-like helix-turn-helix DNA-binding protein [Kitasatospora sp. NPDC006697]|uniref:sigma factor-like helix-turn-helix DNA-binding protein n=1 Tax=Kitasatospora sp. NPDC006697 TaxID=3364020 RepID=UPI0036BD961F